ncbi:hypothetical protein L2D05_03330 [Alphaproteobacteria bacterium LMO-S08]|nr:hypothetical protein [Alphaproteobacteria bacterium LMO-S08]
MADHIQIGDITPRKRYVADGVQTLFTYPFPIFKAVDLEVYLDGALQETGYEVSGAGHDLGGEVTFGTAPTMGVAVTLRRRLTIARQSDFQESGAFRARVINDELDFLTAALQQVADDTRRALQLSPTDPDAVLTLPDRAARGGTFLAFDAEGKPVPGAGSIGGLPTTTFITTLLDDTDAPATRGRCSPSTLPGHSTTTRPSPMAPI